jgi:phage FluMu protein Com
MQRKYIRCARCGKILAAWIGNGCIEIKNGNRHAAFFLGSDGYADITCRRCGMRNIFAPLPQEFVSGERAVSVGAGKPLKEGVEE